MKKRFRLAMIAVLLWSTTAPLAKAIQMDIPNMEVLCLSALFAAFFLLLINLANGNLTKIGKYSVREIGTICGIGFVGLFLYTALYYYGLSKLSAQEACVLNYLWPVMLLVFSCILLKEKLTVRKCVAIVCSFIGIIILTAGPASVGRKSVSGMICCIFGAACYGLYSVLNKKTALDEELTITMMLNWLVVAVCAGISGALTENWVQPSAVQWLGIGWLGIMTDAIGYLIWAMALKGIENVAPIANLAYLCPFLSLLLSALFLREQLSPRAGIALVFIVGGILFQQVQIGKTKGEKRSV